MGSLARTIDNYCTPDQSWHGDHLYKLGYDYPLVMSNIAIENGHRNSELSH